MFIHSAPIISGTVSAAAVLILLLVFSAVLLPCFLRKRFFSGNSAAEYKGRIKTAGILLLLMAALTSVVSADGETGITLGSGAINTGNNVYFGNILWRVLYGGTGKDDLEVTNAGQALLISNDILARTQFNYETTFRKANEWKYSYAQGWCADYYDKWPTGVEKDAILATTVNEENNEQGYFYQIGNHNGYSYGAAPLNGEHFFFLSAKEADSLYFAGSDRSATGAGTYDWWLRSPHANISTMAGFVGSDGGVHNAYVNNNYGARPAFNLNLTSVLFSSEIPQSSNQYKLTLKDENLSISVTNVTRNGSTVTIPYAISGTNAGTETKAYVLVTSKAYTESDAAVLQYTALAAGGTGTFTIDSSWGTNYKVYLLAVNEGGEKKTDTASAPVEITIPTKSDQTVTAPTAVSNLTYTGSAQTLISAGTAENGTMKYAVTTENTKPADTAYTFTDSSLPTGTDAKTYYVWYRSIGNEGYNDYDGSSSVSVTIAWREIETPEPERPGIDFFLLRGDCELPATGFSSLRPAVLPEQPKDLRYEPVRMHLMLPTLDQDIELVTMPREGNSWAAAWLGSDAGLLEGSALPGEGVSIIAGHNTLNDTDYGPFALLAALEVNDTVMVREESGALKLFRVYANELLEPDDMERLSALAGEDGLVLLTCENESAAGGYLNRRAVFAR